MHNKKQAIILTIIAIVSFTAVATFFLYKPITQKLTPQETSLQQPTGDLPELICNYASDQEAYTFAIEQPDVNVCACIKDTERQNTCTTVAMDNTFFTNGITTLDAGLCDRISTQEQKNACLSLITSKTEQLQQQDPQYLARILAATHNEGSITVLEDIIQNDNTNIDNYVSLALAYAEKGLNEQEKGNDHMSYVQKAFTVIEQAKAIDPNNAELYRAEAYVNEIKPDYSTALLLYDKAIERDPNNILAYAGRGHTGRMMGMLEQAVTDLTKAAELDTKNEHISIYTNLCNLEYSRSHNEDAIKNCKIVTQQQNVDPVFQSEAYQIMARIFMDNKDLTQAKSYLLTAKTRTPNDPNLYVTLARLNLFEKNYTESENNAKKAIELTPTKATAYLALANALYMQENYQQAIDTAQKGITLVQDDVSLLAPNKPAIERDLTYMIAHSYRNLGDTQKQKEYEQKAETVFTNPIN
jgi:tetratricopeptide (TPR) repeat protein